MRYWAVVWPTFVTSDNKLSLRDNDQDITKLPTKVRRIRAYPSTNLVMFNIEYKADKTTFSCSHIRQGLSLLYMVQVYQAVLFIILDRNNKKILLFDPVPCSLYKSCKSMSMCKLAIYAALSYISQQCQEYIIKRE